MIEFEELKKIDVSDMFSAIVGFSSYAEEGIEIGAHFPKINIKNINKIVILGMGGSAIGGDLLRSYIHSFSYRNGIDISICRGYVPQNINKNTLVIASSYSGDTEETISAFKVAIKSAGYVIVISTGGTILKLAKRDKFPTIIIPSGLQPRAALALSFFPLLQVLAINQNLFGDEIKNITLNAISETLDLLKKLTKIFSSGSNRNNKAYTLAQKINGKIPVIYSSSDRLDAVNLRFRGQIQENAKSLAFGNLLPEMNHNEINSWQNPVELQNKFVAIFLHDKDDHERVSKRMVITKNIISKSTRSSIDIVSQGNSLIARMFSLILLADWTSYYLALFIGVDPTPVPIIQNLKKKLVD
ncbi:MAG: bifunctional phosphoglucose/phosphomannose isomerase [Chlorobi bacterium]|nr:bifunctional phosphoglucose/phosphomannose isomerase [Chlorobiota bacterium]